MIFDTNFYLISIYMFFIFYILFVVLKKRYLSVLKEIEIHLFNRNLKENREIKKINNGLYIIYIIFIYWLFFLSMYKSSYYFSFLLHQKVLKQITIIILSFIFGLIFGQGKNIIYHYFCKSVELITSIILFGTLAILIAISNHLNKDIYLITLFIHLLISISYYKSFNK